MHALGHFRDLLDIRTVVRVRADAGIHQTTELCVCVCVCVRVCKFELTTSVYYKSPGCLTESGITILPKAGR